MTSGSAALQVDPDAWARHGGRTAFEFTHSLLDHPLLALGELAALADRLPPNDVEDAEGALPVVKADGKPAPIRDEVASELVRTVVERGALMSLMRIEQDAQYRGFIEALLEEFRDSVGRPEGLDRVEGYVFVSSPGAVTPTHIDHEHNLYFQLRGTKHFTVGSCATPEDEHRLLEDFYSGAYGATSFYPHDPITHVLKPGDGLYVPPAAIHVVKNDDEPAISLSVVFHTPDLDRAAKVYALNADLRRLRLHPRPPGQRARVDAAKATVVDLWRWTRAKLRRRSASSA
jgi:quercetin dioxygenase-like cupin family protein